MSRLPTPLRVAASSTGSHATSALALLGSLALTTGRTVRAAPRLWFHELLRALAQFGAGSLGVAGGVAALAGALVVMQTSLYVERFGVRQQLGWAASYAVLWEFGPLLLGIMMAARVGARNAAELAALNVGGQLEGLRGVSLDPYALLVAPRLVAVMLSTMLLAPAVYCVAIGVECVAAWAILDLPVRAFFQSAELMLGWQDLLGGMSKSLCFGVSIALISTAVGLSAREGARAVGAAASRAMTYSCFSIFLLDFLLTSFLSRVLG